MEIPKDLGGQLKFWQANLKDYQKKYRQLKKESPDRWWHDEHFENQLKVLESLIISARQRTTQFKLKLKSKPRK
ncbi:MAG: hypothetical protein ABIB61_04105 [Candidatus Shapirobacteria bacterium]